MRITWKLERVLVFHVFRFHPVMFETSLCIAVLCTEGNGPDVVHAFSPSPSQEGMFPLEKMRCGRGLYLPVLPSLPDPKIHTRDVRTLALQWFLAILAASQALDPPTPEEQSLTVESLGSHWGPSPRGVCIRPTSPAFTSPKTSVSGAT